MAVFLAVSAFDDKALALRELVSGAAEHRFATDAQMFRSIPNSPFAYWASREVIAAFERLPPLKTDKRSAYFGASTKDDFRFLRCWFEPGKGHNRWIAHAKGGSYSKFYADLSLVLNWADDGSEIKAFVSRYRASRGWGDQWSAELKGARHYFRPGLTWPRRTNGLSVRAMPGRTVFGDKGPAILVSEDDHTTLMSLNALLNSRPFYQLVALQLARKELAQSFEVGLLQGTPVPPLSVEASAELNRLARAGWSLGRGLDAAVEVSHAFVVPAVLQVEGETLSGRVSAWAGRVAEAETRLSEVQAEIDELCFGLYGISKDDRRVIVEGFGVVADGDGADSEGADDVEGDDDEGGVELDPAGLAAGLVSWAVGVGVGRFDVRLATGARCWPEEPDPFDPLPVCSPGMLTSEEGLPLVVPPAGYPAVTSSVLVDDPGHTLDITERVRSVFEAVFGDAADGWWSDVGAVLGARGGEVGGWLRKGLFDHHLRTYSRSRRKAPVLWPIGMKSGSYLVWLYAHRVSADSLFQVLHDIVVPKLSLEERELTRLRQDAGPSPSASQRKAIDAKERFVAELRELRDELEAVAPLWAPDLNDGVVIVLAPLWRLFAHHRSWSNELKKHWEKLVKGDYDWARLAMHLWPERVVPKCAADRSLAIAHGLEDVFWVQDPDNGDKWHPRREPTTPIDALIAQRQNPAVAPALQRAAT